VLPYGRPGMLGASLLGLGRALGETMAVTMVIGNSPEIRASLFAPGYSLPAVIANEFAEATSATHTGALAALALILFGITFVLNSVARLLVRAVSRGPARARA
jgi:phosphate transport system permease protein